MTQYATPEIAKRKGSEHLIGSCDAAPLTGPQGLQAGCTLRGSGNENPWLCPRETFETRIKLEFLRSFGGDLKQLCVARTYKEWTPRGPERPKGVGLELCLYNLVRNSAIQSRVKKAEASFLESVSNANLHKTEAATSFTQTNLVLKLSFSPQKI